MKERSRGLILAIERAGSVSALARALGISTPAVSKWLAVPAKRCRAVERITGVNRYELRPDIYGDPPRRPGNVSAAA